MSATSHQHYISRYCSAVTPTYNRHITDILFFNVCDGIFLNYGWKDESLERTRDRLVDCKRPYEALVGVDVFGRGCRGGGGFNTKEAIQAARDLGLSAAIFAQGWVYEKLENKSEFTEKEDKFWSLIDHLCYPHPSLTLPFYTNFCHGQGDQFFINGQVVQSGPWTNLALQGIQPTHTNSEIRPREGEEDERNASEVTHTERLSSSSCRTWRDDAFTGGSSLKLSAALKKEKKSHTFSLFDASCSLPENLYVCYSYKILSSPDHDLHIDLKVKGQAGEKTVSLCGEDKDGDVIKPLVEDHVTSLLSNFQVWGGQNGWRSRHYLVELGAGNDLLGINATINKPANIDSEVQMLLGYLQLVDGDTLNDLPLITDLHTLKSHVKSSPATPEEQNGGEEKKEQKLSLQLSWTFPENLADYYTIYWSPSPAPAETGSEWVLLGHTTATMYHVVDADLGVDVKTVKFKVIPVLRSGLRPKPEKEPEVTIEV